MRFAHTAPVRAVVLSGLCLFLLDGCLLTMGSALLRRVEPDRWTVQAGGGLTAAATGDRAGTLTHLYVGRALGRHFEVGLMPYAYSLPGTVVPALYLSLKWDPFPVEWPVRWILHAGPVAYIASELLPGPVIGTGFAFEIGTVVEAYLGVSTVIPAVQLTSFGAGVRLNPSDRFSFGLGAVVGLPTVFGAEMTASLLLGD